MENICEWKNCNESGKFKAPLEKDNSRSYQWLCEEHIKSFNKNWNYFEGMSQKEIESFVKSDLTWHRPTQKFGSFDNFFNILWNNALSDKFIREDKIFNSSNNKKFSEKLNIEYKKFPYKKKMSEYFSDIYFLQIPIFNRKFIEKKLNINKVIIKNKIRKLKNNTKKVI